MFSQTTELFMDAKSIVLLFVNKRKYHGLLFFFFQEKHKQELEDMRKAGHEALSIIVDEYKVED